MSQQNPFDLKNIRESSAPPQEGLLEHLNLPPAVISFIRDNQRTIWIVVIAVAVTVTAVSLYGSYRSYRENQASSALAQAMQAEEAQKKEMLADVVEEYGSTPAGMWGRIELAHMAAAGGDLDGAIAGLSEIRDSVSRDNPVTPLLVYNLGLLHEKKEAPEQARNYYNELLAFEGFDAIAYKSMGRAYEQQGDRDQALVMYRKYIETLDNRAGEGLNDPDRTLIEARINNLEG
jgi:predicted negative regulator of RcsB-dependent stress response